MNFEGEFVRAVDGDTYEIRVDVSHFDPERPIWTPRIRCAFLDTPERGEFGWEDAKNGLAWRLKNRPLKITTFGRDSFRRLVAETYAEGEAYSQWAVTAGYGRYRHVAEQLS